MTLLLLLAASAAPPPVRYGPDGEALPVHALARYGEFPFRSAFPVAAAAFTGDSAFLVTAEAGHIVVRDCANGRVVRRFPTNATVTDLAASEGRTFAAVAGGVFVFDARGGPGRRTNDLPDGATPERLALSPDGSRLAVAARGAVYLYDVRAGRRVASVPALAAGPKRLAVRPTFAPDGASVAVVGPSGRLDLHDATDGRFLRSLEPERASGSKDPPVTWCRFAPNGKRLATAALGSPDVYVREAATGRAVRLFVRRADLSQRATGDGLRFSPDGSTLFDVRGDRPCVHDLVGAASPRDLPLPAAATSGGVAVSLDGRFLAGFGGRLAVVRLDGDKKEGRIDWPVVRTAWIDDMLGQKGGSRVPSNRTATVHPYNAHLAPATNRALSPDPNDASPERRLRLIDTLTHKEMVAWGAGVVRPHEHGFSLCGRRFALVSPPDRVRLHESEAGRIIRILHGCDAGGVFSPDGRLFVVGRESVRVVEVDTGAVLMRRKGGPRQGPRMFSPDGRFLAEWDGETVLVTDVEAGAAVARFRCGSYLTGAAFSPDGLRFATMHGDRSIVEWAVPDVLPHPKIAELSEDAAWADLDSADAVVARRAMRRLRASPAFVIARLRDEARPARGPASARHVRAAEVLERAGTAEAREALVRLARDTGDPQLRRDALAAAARLRP